MALRLAKTTMFALALRGLFAWKRSLRVPEHRRALLQPNWRWLALFAAVGHPY
jgi:hypothetical protein